MLGWALSGRRCRHASGPAGERVTRVAGGTANVYPAPMTERIAAQFRRFAEKEARGHSALYEALALGVADDGELLSLLAALPRDKQQPNLLLAAVRLVCGTPADFPAFRASLLGRTADIVAAILARRTQTNEPGRCAVLLPVLARLHQPLALIEVGASAGLCLIPEHYAYDYNGTRLGPTAAPVFPCLANDATPIPQALPRITWRAGLDLDPVSPRDPEQMAWLEALIWPDQPDRLARFRAAADLVRRTSVRVRRGDLSADLGALIDEVPNGPTIVVFHSATLAYVPDPVARAAFATLLWEKSAVWISNEAPFVFPDIAARAARPGPPGAFLLAVNGQPVAWTDPHGAWIDWLG